MSGKQVYDHFSESRNNKRSITTEWWPLQPLVCGENLPFKGIFPVNKQSMSNRRCCWWCCLIRECTFFFAVQEIWKLTVFTHTALQHYTCATFSALSMRNYVLRTTRVSLNFATPLTTHAYHVAHVYGCFSALGYYRQFADVYRM